MRPLFAHRFFGQPTRHVMIEAHIRVFVAGLAAITRGLLQHRVSVAGVIPPIIWNLTTGRDHLGHQDQQIDREPIGDQGRGERAKRLAHENQIPPIADDWGDGRGARVVWTLQRSLIYLPQGSPSRPAADAVAGAQDVTLMSADRLRLAAWHVPARHGRATLLVANGNAGHYGLRALLAAALAQHGSEWCCWIASMLEHALTGQRE